MPGLSASLAASLVAVYYLAMRLLITILFCLLAFSGAVYAEACTYSEAILALQHGNQVRAQALLRMAARDGDQRAVKMMAKLQLPDPAKQNHVKTANSLRIAAQTSSQ